MIVVTSIVTIIMGIYYHKVIMVIGAIIGTTIGTTMIIIIVMLIYWRAIETILVTILSLMGLQ